MGGGGVLWWFDFISAWDIVFWEELFFISGTAAFVRFHFFGVLPGCFGALGALGARRCRAWAWRLAAPWDS